MILWTVVAFGALILLHLLEPNLPIAWSYAGLRLRWGSVVPGVAVVVATALLVGAAWSHPLARRPFPRPRPATLIVGMLLLWLVLALVGLRWPSPDVCPDALFLPNRLRNSGAGNGRYLLLVPLLQMVFAPLRGIASPETVLRVTNALFSSLSMLVTLAIATRLGRSIREVVAVLLLVWTGFGSLQLSLGYVDVYPIVQLLMALYVWTAMRYLDGDGGPVWPVVLAVLGPCFYIGLILVGPSLLVLVLCAWQRGQLVRLAGAVGVAILVAGLATVPAFGVPFALRAWSERLASASWRGLNPDGQTLPLGYILSLRHAGEVLSTLVLLDGVGLVLVATLSPRSLRAALLWCILGSGFAFVVAMDPVWGPYSDWDLFSYLTLPLGVAAGLAFVSWSRSRPALAGAVLALAVATSAVHLMARVNGLHLDFERHIAASPYHLPDVPNGIFKPRTRWKAW